MRAGLSAPFRTGKTSSSIVLHAVRESIEQRERDNLSPYAALASASEGRVLAEDKDPVRTDFQRDRDRILHSKSFRRLKHKTQVFIDPEGDHYRTRLTHSLEVAQIARTICRALRLNEDLAEAIALGHDVGHTPFGHAGESALDDAIKKYWAERGQSVSDQMTLPVVDEPAGPPRRFRHWEQSLRVVDVLEGLNLTQETRAGIGGHSKGRNDLSAHDGQPTSTLEAAVVRISDRIAYLNHDLDDAIRSGIIDAVPEPFLLGGTHSRRIGAMVQDVISHSLDRPAIALSPAMLATMNALKEWLFDNVYLEYPKRFPDTGKVQEAVRRLFAYYLQPKALPEGYMGFQGAIDYVAGMSDRFAMERYAELVLPKAWVRE